MRERPERESWLEPVEPPTGGLDRLRRRLARHERWRAVRRSGAVTAGAVLLVLALVWAWPHRPGPVPALGTGDDLMAVRLGLAEPPKEPVSIPAGLQGEMAVRRLPTNDERVVFYRLGTVRR